MSTFCHGGLAEHLLMIAANARKNSATQGRGATSAVYPAGGQPSIAVQGQPGPPVIARTDILSFKACIDGIQKKLTNVEEMVAGLRGELDREQIGIRNGP
jgi:hypothetical protein